jgi:hypothetical protein
MASKTQASGRNTGTHQNLGRTKVPRRLRKQRSTMSIRLIARELYQLEQEVERLEKSLNSAAGGQKGDLQEQLRKVKAERDRMRRILEGSKEPLPYRKVPK